VSTNLAYALWLGTLVIATPLFLVSQRRMIRAMQDRNSRYLVQDPQAAEHRQSLTRTQRKTLFRAIRAGRPIEDAVEAQRMLSDFDTLGPTPDYSRSQRFGTLIFTAWTLVLGLLGGSTFLLVLGACFTAMTAIFWLWIVYLRHQVVKSIAATRRRYSGDRAS
jgi:hypothetical protein